MSRDQAEEAGGAGLFGLLSNGPLDQVDPVGLAPFPAMAAFPGTPSAAGGPLVTIPPYVKDCIKEYTPKKFPVGILPDIIKCALSGTPMEKVKCILKVTKEVDLDDIAGLVCCIGTPDAPLKPKPGSDEACDLDFCKCQFKNALSPPELTVCEKKYQGCMAACRL